MNAMTPVRPEFINKIKSLERRQYQQQTARQPVFIRWLELSDSNFSYNDSRSLTVSKIDATTRFNLGDKVRFKQGGAYKHFYVVKVTSTLLYLEAGTDYSVADAEITNIAVSGFPNPNGFPSLFEYDVNADGWSSLVDERGWFYIFGTRVFLIFSVVGTSNANYAKIDLPTINAIDIPGGPDAVDPCQIIDNGSTVLTKKTDSFINANANPLVRGSLYGMIDFDYTGFTSSNDKAIMGGNSYSLAN
jgi:hypothetical protein